MSASAPLTRHIEVGELLPGAGMLRMAASIFLPERPRSAPVALFCSPGGAMNRGYFDLRAAGAPAEFSFAAHLCAAGCHVIALDPLGIGDSTRPLDGHALTPDLLAQALARACAALRRQLTDGSLTGTPLKSLRSVGVGHSMGAMLTAMAQAQHGGHEALMLFGFGTQGLSSALTAEEAALAHDPAAARANLTRLARMRSADPYPQIGRTQQARELFAGERADRRGVEALQAARAPLLVTPGLFSMIPGSCAPECAQLATPLLLAAGDRDIAGAPHELPASFPASRDITLLVLPETGHCHFLFDSRRSLFARAAQWCDSVFPQS